MRDARKLVKLDPWLTPYTDAVQLRLVHSAQYRKRILDGASLIEFALGHRYFGLQSDENGWVLREWAPHATAMYLVSDMSGWEKSPNYAFIRQGDEWELQLPEEALPVGSHYKLLLEWPGGSGYRIPAYAPYVVQDEQTKEFTAVVTESSPFTWRHDSPESPAIPMIYEAHVGMSSAEEKVASYREFADTVLPRVKAGGYNTVQLMAVAEHPYYGSFGYHVSSYFAPSSRCGTPDGLRYLIDTAHGMGLRVIMDIVHSHAVRNEAEGLSRFDGSLHQYFHSGDRGRHALWDSRLFDYGKPQVAHFLLSNLRYWLDEFRFDGFRFDGVTSMLYTHHGQGKAFTSYDEYFGNDIELDALAYLTTATELIHTLRPDATVIAEEMSGYPGLAAPVDQGGIGFDYRMSMGVPDLWIRTLKQRRDEEWNLGEIVHELTARRPEEKVISYAESHDQALVGDKTLIFRLIDKDMYWHMATKDVNLAVERGVALRKLIYLLTAALHGGGYLNFMGNEFGHPEWIDFPRAGNDWSYHYARRQWDLADDAALQYHHLQAFDRAMVRVVSHTLDPVEDVAVDEARRVVSFRRGRQVYIVNLSPDVSYTDLEIAADDGEYEVVLSTDAAMFGGQDRIDTMLPYATHDGRLRLYVPARTGVVLRRRLRKNQK
jgi:1,4-alpha-glucan branching enzyme